jgi:hypothetical protein
MSSKFIEESSKAYQIKPFQFAPKHLQDDASPLLDKIKAGDENGLESQQDKENENRTNLLSKFNFKK